MMRCSFWATATTSLSDIPNISSAILFTSKPNSRNNLVLGNGKFSLARNFTLGGFGERKKQLVFHAIPQISKYRFNVVRFQLWIAPKQLLFRPTRRQQFENQFNRYTCSFNSGFTNQNILIR